MKLPECQYCKVKFQRKYSAQRYCCRNCYNLDNTEIFENGRLFGHLVVLDKAEPHVKIQRISRSKVKCVCGKEFITTNRNLRSGHTNSCGCKRETHGHCKIRAEKQYTPTYNSWQAMIARCHNSKHHNYKHYGARGIVVCPEWRHNFQAFLDHVGERPIGKTIDRKDVNKNYEPGNVRWATQKQQCNNKRSRPKVEKRSSVVTVGL